MKRPTFLTIWLVLTVIGDAFSLYFYTLGSSLLTTSLPNFPSWAFPVYDALIVLQLVSVILLWNWKKIGFYLSVALAIIATVLNGFTLGTSGIGSIAFGLIGMVILYLAMRPVWEHFK